MQVTEFEQSLKDAAPFDLAFSRQFVRNGFEAPASLERVRRLTASPSIYLQRAGLSDATVAALERAAPRCSLSGTIAPELGHALGFTHAQDVNALMAPSRPLSHSGLPSERERYHAAIAYQRPVGSTDVDVDPAGSVSLAPLMIE